MAWEYLLVNSYLNGTCFIHDFKLDLLSDSRNREKQMGKELKPADTCAHTHGHKHGFRILSENILTGIVEINGQPSESRPAWQYETLLHVLALNQDISVLWCLASLPADSHYFPHTEAVYESSTQFSTTSSISCVDHTVVGRLLLKKTIYKTI